MNTKTKANREEIDGIIRACQVCFLAMVDENNQPYVLPFNFGYRNGMVYFHSAPEGHKIDILRKNPSVCISFSTDYQLRFQSENMACSYGMRYRSVLAYGKVVFIEEYNEKLNALNIIMSQYTDKEFTYSQPSVVNVKVYSVVIEKFDVRIHGYN